MSELAYDTHTYFSPPVFLNLGPEKLPSKFQLLYKRDTLNIYVHGGVEDGETAPLSMCQHSIPHEPEQGRFQGHCLVIAGRGKDCKLLSFRRQAGNATAQRQPTERFGWRQQ